MQHKIQNKLLGFVRVLEIFIAFLIAIAIIISALALIPDLWQFIGNYGDSQAFRVFLGYAFNTLIGIEFLKMLIKHSTASVIEVLLFAIARELIVEHTTPFENLMSIISIAILFAIRRFLFVSTFDDGEGGEGMSQGGLMWFKHRFKKHEAPADDSILAVSEGAENILSDDKGENNHENKSSNR